MARLYFIDDSYSFTYAQLRGAAATPLGGIQVATLNLAAALAACGHAVTIFNEVSSPSTMQGVSFVPRADMARFPPSTAAIANCAPKLLTAKSAAQKILWLHGPARYVRKPKHLWPLLRHRAVPVFSSAYQASTWPLPTWLAPRRPIASATIPLGIGAEFLDATPRPPPPPLAVFMSNPRRNLDWVLRVWAEQIWPNLPPAVQTKAQLWVYGGRQVYGNRPDPALEAALAPLANYEQLGVVAKAPVPRQELAAAMRAARLLLYAGDAGETFCLIAAEAQASGLPLVTAGWGCLAERLLPDVTGFLAPTPASFGAAACRLLTDDDVWQAQHQAALAWAQPNWAKVAELWEKQFGWG